MSGTRIRVARRLAAALAAGDGAQTAHEPLGGEECATDSMRFQTHPGELPEAFGGRQRELSDRAERCLQGTLRDRALLREVEKLMREVDAYEEDDVDDGADELASASGAASRGPQRASRATSCSGLPPSSSRRLGGGGWQTDRAGAGSGVRGGTSGTAAVRSCYRPTSARDSEASADARSTADGGLIVRRLAKADALQSRLSEAAEGSARLEVELDLARDSNARLQRRLDDALQARPRPAPRAHARMPAALACGRTLPSPRTHPSLPPHRDAMQRRPHQFSDAEIALELEGRPRTPPLSARAAAAEAAEEARAERRLHQKLMRLRQYDAPPRAQRHAHDAHDGGGAMPQGAMPLPPSAPQAAPVVPQQQHGSRARGAARPEMA